ncbi:E3 ubiquitin/ISG15 ligase TRIM25-like [Halichoeres trimaculatus]|uniref:E3 ubiquitin/ISG15 ligase TRIM25-like n=1 Tax=Halichoeres trimaculatus TaxID=147232 RepID=UPI003D9FA9F0
MALQLQQDKLSCSLCLGLLKDPVTAPCGHSFCLSCVTHRWDEEAVKRIYSCSECGQTFTPRPELRKMKLQEASSPGDVPCDCCSERKLRAVKSCLVCRVSYCGLHLQPHYDSPAFEKHKLIEPTVNLQEKFCSRHDEVMKIYCRTDQKTICIFCSLDEHKDHDTVSAAAERKEKSREVGTRRQSIQLQIIEKEKDVKALQREMEAIHHSAEKAVAESEEILSELVNLIERRKSELKEEIRAQQESEISRVRELEEKLKVEISELKTKDAELEKLSHSNDHVHFLLGLSRLSHLSESAGSPSFNTRSLRHFQDVTAAVSKARHRVEDILHQEWTNIKQEVAEVDIFLPRPEPRTREEFLKYWRQMTLDPNTANTRLMLSDGNRRATVTREKQVYPCHSVRFRDWLQVLSAEGLSGRCYWEVERSSGVCVGVAYRDLSRTGSESGFGNNERSWALGCFDMTFYFRHNGVKTLLSGPQSSRVGVFLDHRAGTLSFYSVSENMSLLHKVQTTFTQPLHAGLWIYWVGDSAELCELQ